MLMPLPRLPGVVPLLLAVPALLKAAEGIVTGVAKGDWCSELFWGGSWAAPTACEGLSSTPALAACCASQSAGQALTDPLLAVTKRSPCRHIHGRRIGSRQHIEKQTGSVGRRGKSQKSVSSTAREAQLADWHSPRNWTGRQARYGARGTSYDRAKLCQSEHRADE